MPAALQLSPGNESFGARLRRERERRQISLASIAENTKIAVSLLQDLERDEVSRWPSGIFRRAFIRAYAQAIGVDPEATAREFLERFPDPNDPDLAAAPPPPGPVPALRLVVAETGAAFTGGHVLSTARRRLIAVGCDAAVIAAIAAVMYTVLGAFWMPLCVAVVGYYAGGILLLGNTPGVCLSSPADVRCSPPKISAAGS